MPLRKARRIEFAPDEWIAGTISLSLAEEGLYIRICSLIYSRGGPIHVSQLHRPGLHGNTLNSILQRLVDTGKVERTGDKIDQKRCREELQTVADRHETRSKSGRKGNETRWGSRENNQVAVAKRVPSAIAKQPSLDLFQSEPADSQPLPPKPEKSHARRGTRLAADWQPNAEDRRYAEELGLNPDEVAENFRDWWLSKPGAGATKLDWGRTWKTWCRTDRDRRAARPERSRDKRQDAPSFTAALRRAFPDVG